VSITTEGGTTMMIFTLGMLFLPGEPTPKPWPVGR
jgi:hypothetical protein